MNVFRTATDVLLTIPLVDDSGNSLDATSISYRVIDADSAEIVPSSPVADFVASEAVVTVAIPAISNTLLAGVARGLRSVELLCITAAGTVAIVTNYLIETADPLILGVNSFQTLVQAEFTSASIPNLTGWNAASTRDRIAALMDARMHINQLNFAPINGNSMWGQDSLNFVPEGATNTNFVSGNGSWLYGGDLSLISVTQFLNLPPRFATALRLAQVAEANFILGGDPEEGKRQSGLVMDQIGESRQAWRNNTSKPLQLPVCRRALSYLGQFVTFARRTNRTA